MSKFQLFMLFMGFWAYVIVGVFLVSWVFHLCSRHDYSGQGDGAARSPQGEDSAP